jgi:hypothetical protein
MHVLGMTKRNITGYLELVKELKTLRFPFASQDCHGKTVAHIALKNERLFAVWRWEAQFVLTTKQIRTKKITIAFREMLSLFNTDLNCRDNSGKSIRSIILDNQSLQGLFGKSLESLTEEFCAPLSFDVNFRTAGPTS